MNKTAAYGYVAVVSLQIIGLLAFASFGLFNSVRGPEILLQIAEPIGPDPVVQGEYAILNYEIATLPEDFRYRFGPGDDVFVVMEGQGDVWDSTLYLNSPKLPQRNGDVFIRGKLVPDDRIDFGIETYFVPEGSAHAIEHAQDIKIRISVTDDGDASITGVILDGEYFDP